MKLDDSLGSGDAFSAGFVHKILRAASLKEACEYGNALGALVATRSGATPHVGTSEIDHMLGGGAAERIIHSDLEEFIA